MNKQVVFLNGPINSGKDALGKMLVDYFKELNYPAQTERFKEKLYQHTAELFKVDKDWLIEIANDRVNKELPCDELHGHSPRQALIFTSENVYKPIYGKDYFGKQTAKELKSGITFITDSGFYEEAMAVVKVVGVENCLVVNIYRDGCGYSSNDSRGYINLDGYSVPRLKLDNNSTLENARDTILNALGVLGED